MTHHEKVEVYLEDMQERGISPWRAAPLLFRLLWRLGVKVPPPVFLPGPAVALVVAGVYALLFTSGEFVISHLFHLMDLGSGWFIFIGIGGLGPGLLIGTTAAFGYQRLAWKLNLPSWKEYGSR